MKLNYFNFCYIAINSVHTKHTFNKCQLCRPMKRKNTEVTFIFHYCTINSGTQELKLNEYNYIQYKLLVIDLRCRNCF